MHRLVVALLLPLLVTPAFARGGGGGFAVRGAGFAHAGARPQFGFGQRFGDRDDRFRFGRFRDFDRDDRFGDFDRDHRFRDFNRFGLNRFGFASNAIVPPLNGVTLPPLAVPRSEVIVRQSDGTFVTQTIPGRGVFRFDGRNTVAVGANTITSNVVVETEHKSNIQGKMIIIDIDHR